MPLFVHRLINNEQQVFIIVYKLISFNLKTGHHVHSNILLVLAGADNR